MTEVLSPGPHIQKRKLSDDVRARLLSMIDSGATRPGDVLPSERQLMERLGVGRPAIREAMQALQRTGLIEIRHGERARVAEPSVGRMVDQVSQSMKHLLAHSPATLEHLKEARLAFEMEMARTAARRHAPRDLHRLQDTLDEQAAAAGDTLRFRMLDGRFHRDIAAISGNPIWSALSDALFRWLSDFHVDLVSAPGAEALTLAEHRDIVEAIGSGSAERASAAMADHLNRANAMYHKVAKAVGPPRPQG